MANTRLQSLSRNIFAGFRYIPPAFEEVERELKVTPSACPPNETRLGRSPKAVEAVNPALRRPTVTAEAATHCCARNLARLHVVAIDQIFMGLGLEPKSST